MASDDRTLSGDEADAQAPGSAGTAPGTRIGDFLVERQLGAGAMGEVLLARNPDTGDRVALKLIARRFSGEENFLKRFEREIDALVRIEHPHIARAIAYGLHGELPFLAMEFVDGRDLAGILDDRGPIHEADGLTIAMQVARGLAHVHTEAGLVHRDVKPSNILLAHPGNPPPGRLLGDKGRVKLIDFGLAKSVDSETEQRLTMTGVIMGTPNYMAPEQVRGEADISYHVDIYALGASLYHLLTGQLPFPGSSPALVMTGHLTKAVPDPGLLVPSLDIATRKLVMTAMAKERKDRFTDWRAFIVACERALHAKGGRETSQVRILRRAPDAIGTPTPVTKFVQRRPSPDAATEVASRPADPTPLTVARIPTPPTRWRTPLPSEAASEQPALDTRIAGAAASASGGDVGTRALRKVLTDKVERMRESSRTYRRQPAAAISAELPLIKPEPLPPLEPPPARWPALIPLAVVMSVAMAVILLVVFLGR